MKEVLNVRHRYYSVLSSGKLENEDSTIYGYVTRSLTTPTNSDADDTHQSSRPDARLP